MGLYRKLTKRVDRPVNTVNLKAPPISVVMSCYNAERWLAESIESVLLQTWPDFEFIIVDDGSTDRTSQIIGNYAKMDSRIVPVSKANTELADSLNKGVACARGIWIARLDADDLCEPERLALQWRAASADGNLVFVGTGSVLIDENGVRSSVYRFPPSHRQLVSHLIKGQKFPAHSSALFRLDAFQRVGGYRPRIRRAQDCDLWLRLAEVGRLESIDPVLVRIRRHDWQISFEDGGRRAMIDSRVAIAACCLRKAGHPDPVDLDAEAFEEFRAWVASQLEKENLFRREAFRLELKTTATKLTFHKLFRTVKLAQSEPKLVWQLGMEQLIGSDLAHRLATKWIARHE